MLSDAGSTPAGFLASHLEPRAVDVRNLVLGMADLLSHSLGPRVEMAFDFAEGLPSAHVDPNQLELALLNLSVNARDVIVERGTLTVAAPQERVIQESRIDAKYS
jgi:signal transduction histidine kinase